MARTHAAVVLDPCQALMESHAVNGRMNQVVLADALATVAAMISAFAS